MRRYPPYKSITGDGHVPTPKDILLGDPIWNPPLDLNTLPPSILMKLWLNCYAHLEADVPDDPVPRCGWYCLSTTAIYNLFGKQDPFLRCCIIHDIEYALKRKPRSQVDRELYNCMKSIAGGNIPLRIAAAVYYGIVKVSGGIFW